MTKSESRCSFCGELADRNLMLPDTSGNLVCPECIGALFDKNKIDKRKSWDEYFMGIAVLVATRATCPRKHVGAVLVRDNTILSTGYNGSIRGLPHCDDVGCMMEKGHCVATTHAEANALVQAARNGVMVNGASCYITASPCWNCFKLLANAGIQRIAYGEFYRDERVFKYAEQLKIELVEIGLETT